MEAPRGHPALRTKWYGVVWYLVVVVRVVLLMVGAHGVAHGVAHGDYQGQGSPSARPARSLRATAWAWQPWCCALASALTVALVSP